MVATLLAAWVLVAGEEPARSATLARGVVVEWLVENGGGQAAGVLPGDVLLGWRVGQSGGRIESPFDLPYLIFAEAPRGIIQIDGLRSGRKYSWRIRKTPWGIACRPNLEQPLLQDYFEAEQLARSGNFAEAVKRWRETAILAHQSEVAWLPSWFLSHAGETLFRARQMEASDEMYGAAVQQAPDQPIVKAEILRQWATQLEAREDLPRAEQYYREELLAWKQLGAELLIAKSLNQLAVLLLREGDFRNAESSFLEALAIDEKSAPNAAETALGYANLAVIYQDNGDLGKAEKYYRRALTIGEKTFPGSFSLAGILTDFGVLARWRGNLDAAEEYHREALSIAEKLKINSSIADIFDNISDCRVDRGDLLGAEAYQQRALAMRRSAGSILPISVSLAALGKVARLQGRLDLAEDYYRRAIRNVEKLMPPPPYRATFLAGLGDVYRDRGNFREAEEEYRQALAVMDQLTPRSFDRTEIRAALGAVLWAQGHSDEASEEYRQALDDVEYQTASMGPAAEAQARYRARRVRYYREYIDLLTEQGKTELAFEISESSHARALFEVLEQGQIEVRKGIQASLLTREQNLRHLLNAKSQYGFRLVMGNHREEQVAALDRELTDLRESYQQVEAEIRMSSPGYAALTQPRPLTVNQIQALLDPETVLLEYSLGQKHSHIWIIGESSLEVRELPEGSAIERLAAQFHRAISTRPCSINRGPELKSIDSICPDRASERLAMRLSRMILSPLSDKIAGKRLVIVPDGALHYVPFSALPAPDAPTVPLILKHEIVSLPSASVLAAIRRANTNRRFSGEVAILADPVFEPTDYRVTGKVSVLFSPTGSRQAGEPLSGSAAQIGAMKRDAFHLRRLIYSREEANAILALTRPANTMTALDFRANRTTVLNPELARYRIIHFATHGFIDTKHPELSGLVLSLVNRQGKPQDGFVGLEDIYNLELPVDLVVLSACSTGLGEEIKGEGVISLTRGFMYAGARRVVASLWNVNDFATSELMASFYRAMERKKMAPAAALREAQIHLWSTKQWRSPYYWAAFQIQGEWN